MPKTEFKDVSRLVIGAAIEVHKKLGPGFLESIYERALCIELNDREISFVNQSEFIVLYNGMPIGKHRLDLLVEGNLVLELKASHRLDEVFYQVVRSYLTALGETEGLLINFGTSTLQVKRIYTNRQSLLVSESIEPIEDRKPSRS